MHDNYFEERKVLEPVYYNYGGNSPFKYIADNKLDFFEGNVIKYVTRHKKKNKLEDLKKAKTYLEYMINNYKNLY